MIEPAGVESHGHDGGPLLSSSYYHASRITPPWPGTGANKTSDLQAVAQMHVPTKPHAHSLCLLRDCGVAACFAAAAAELR